MSSLTSFLPELIPLFGMTEQAIYERQRALVRMKMLAAPKGRGRGSGVEATPETVARLIVALLATENLSDTDDRVQRLAFAPFTGTDKRVRKPARSELQRCPWTGARTFVDALTFLFSRDAPIRPSPKPDGHTSVYVNRRDLTASIYFATSGRSNFSNFGHRDRVDRRAVEVRAALNFEGIRFIHQQLNFGGKIENSPQQ
jgi:hypothetical protein